jgi:hypothetical protein
MVVQELTQQDRTAAARASQIDVDDVRADGGAPGSSWQQLAAALAQQDRTAAARINFPPSTATRAAGGAPAAAAAASCGTVAAVGAMPVKSEPAGGGESARVLVARYKKAIAVSGDTRPLKGLLKEHGGCWNGRLRARSPWTALYHRSYTSYQIRLRIRCLYF